MRVIPISHRGLWEAREERNTAGAFRRSLADGFGIETDLRDRGSRIMIAHDLSDQGEMSLGSFFDLYSEYPSRPTLALNIKADGLQDEISREIDKYAIHNYFVFDMSVPDLLGYRAKGLIYYTRVSEFEPIPSALDKAAGVWVDQFEGDWVDAASIERLSSDAHKLCLVSPELHGRDPEIAWSRYRAAPSASEVLLCTDRPRAAREYFGD